MAEPRMTEVVNELLRLSATGKLAWEKSIRKSEYRVVFPDLSFNISMEDNGGYRLNLIGDTGQVIDSFGGRYADILIEQQGYEDEDTGPIGEDHILLGKIYRMAESYVKNVGIAKALEVLRQA